MYVFLKELGYMTEDNIWSNKKNTRGRKTTTNNPTCPVS